MRHAAREGDACPATSATVAASDDGPEQSLAVEYHVKVTVPVGGPSAVPVTVASS